MPSKLNPFEQHVEKLVLGVAVAGVVGVAVWEFGLSESTVKFGGRDVPIASLDAALEREAQALQAKLRDDADPGVKLPELQQSTTAMLEERMRSGAKLTGGAAANGPRFAGVLVKDGLSKDVAYHVPQLPAPTGLLVQSTSDAITDEGKTTFAQYLESRLAGGANDITWTTPSAVIDLASMRAELLASEDDARALPTRWWENTLLIADVVFERETRDEHGVWGSPIVVDPVGTQLAADLSFRTELAASPIDPTLRGTVVETLKQSADQLVVLRPDFYPTKRGAWSEPSDEVVAAPTGLSDEQVKKLRDLDKAKRDLATLEKQRVRLEAELKELGGRLDQADADAKKKDADKDKGSSGAGGDGGGGGGFGFGGGGGMKGRRDPNAGKDAEKDKKRVEKTKQFDRVVKQIEDKRKLVTDLGGTAAEVEQAAEQVDLSKDPTVRVWTHDVQVEAGETYRYRCTLKLLNPFLGKETVLTAGQQPLAKQAAIASASSAWSEPFTVPSELEVFVTQASLRGRGEATVEVYRLHDGQRQVERFNVNPGDLIGAIASERTSAPGVDFTTEWFIVDIFPDPKAPADQAADRAMVVIQDLNGKLIEYRVPLVDKSSGVRAGLSAEARASKPDAPPPATTPTPPDSGAPMGPGGGPAGGGGGEGG